MENQLQAEIEAYNAAMDSKGGHIMLQRFVGKADVDDTSDSDSDKKKRHKPDGSGHLYSTNEQSPSVCTTIWRDGLL